MSEFSSKTTQTPQPSHTPAQVQGGRFKWMTRPLLLGMSLPWIVGFSLILIAAGWYLFAPDSPPSVNQLAFGGYDLQPVTSELREPVPVAGSSDLAQVKTEVAAMVSNIRDFGETNRDAITRLDEAFKAQSAQVAAQVAGQQQEINELRAQISLLSASSSHQVSKAGPPRRAKPATAVQPAPSPLAGMRVSAVQKGMAWVFWQEKTWAVQVGDPIGTVTVTGIDAHSRQVLTSAGTIK